MRQALIAILSVLILVTGGAAVSASAQTVCVTSAPNGSCPGGGAYHDSSIPMSNGFNTYVVNQDVGANSGTTNTLTATGPGNWNVMADEEPPGYGGVQYFDNVQQLTNDWTGSGWSGGSSDTPFSALSVLRVNYTESMPTDSDTSAEFAPDVWTSNYPSDVMFWADTQGRCNNGAYGPTVLGTAVLRGQTWTVNRYGGPGAEIIFVLDSNPKVPDSCAKQESGTIPILAGFKWLVANGAIAKLGSVTQLNTGWEITSAGSTQFTMSSYSITATVAK